MLVLPRELASDSDSPAELEGTVRAWWRRRECQCLRVAADRFRVRVLPYDNSDSDSDSDLRVDCSRASAASRKAS